MVNYVLLAVDKRVITVISMYNIAEVPESVVSCSFSKKIKFCESHSLSRSRLATLTTGNVFIAPSQPTLKMNTYVYVE